MSAKDFLRAWKRLPEQVHRAQRFDKYVENRIKSAFTSSDGGQSYTPETVAQELEALNRIANSDFEGQYALRHSSAMKTFLPQPETYRLLDQEGQLALEKKRSPLTVLFNYLTGKEKMRNA